MATSAVSDQFAQVRGFRVEIDHGGVVEADADWETFSDGALIVQGRFQTTTPGHKSVGEVTLRGAMTDKRAALCTWINDTVKGKVSRRMVTITELLFGADGSVKDGKQYIYYDCFPTGYVFPHLSVASSDPTGVAAPGEASCATPLVEELRFAYSLSEVIEPVR